MVSLPEKTHLAVTTGPLFTIGRWPSQSLANGIDPAVGEPGAAIVTKTIGQQKGKRSITEYHDISDRKVVFTADAVSALSYRKENDVEIDNKNDIEVEEQGYNLVYAEKLVEFLGL